MHPSLKPLWFVLVLILCAGVVHADVPAPIAVNPQSLGWWNEGAPGSTHARWDFTAGYVISTPGAGYSAKPEFVISPDPLNVVATIGPGGTWDNQTLFIGSTYLAVNLELPNYLNQNPYKEIWVDLGNNVVNTNDISVAATPTNLAFVYEILAGQGNAEFGVRIWPNPEVEKVGFVLFRSPTGAPLILDYIHVDTICIPEPMTLAMLALGGILLRRRMA
jgi:hypothetical protein